MWEVTPNPTPRAVSRRLICCGITTIWKIALTSWLQNLCHKGFAPAGTLEVGDLGELAYTYVPLERNFNARSLQGFSTQAEEKMYNCGNCPYATYVKYYKYYGVFDYANHWVLAAFNRGSTNFSNGNAVFTTYGMEGTTGM
jgi:hypothetical protein